MIQQLYIHVCIRSPLSVVHAGLDIVRADIQTSAGHQSQAAANMDSSTSSAVYISAETVAMIDQIFSASGTTVEILDDLLVYEQIDSGDVISVIFHHHGVSFCYLPTYLPVHSYCDRTTSLRSADLTDHWTCILTP